MKPAVLTTPLAKRPRVSQCGGVWLPRNVMLLKRHRVPLASLGGEKIAAIDVYGACKLIDRIDNGMDDVRAQRLSIHRAQSFRAGCLDFVWRSFHAPPKHIVFPAFDDCEA